MERFVLGVTGVAGSGKSTLCKILEKKFGYEWINADAIVHALYKPGQPGYRKIRAYFGERFIGKKGVKRGRLRQFVLKTPQKLWILNKLIHPYVIHEVNKKIVQLKGPCALEAIYFDPKDLGKFIQRLMVIDATDQKILSRIRNRKIPPSQIRALLKFQRKNLPRPALRLENNGSRRELEKGTEALLRRIWYHGST